MPIDTVIQCGSTSRSGTIAAGGTAQQLMPANPSRRAFLVQNQSAGPLYIRGNGIAATADNNSLLIAAGALYESSDTHVGTGAMSIIGATTGQAFHAPES